MAGPQDLFHPTLRFIAASMISGCALMAAANPSEVDPKSKSATIGHFDCKNALKEAPDAPSDKNPNLPDMLTHSQILITPEYDLRFVRHVATSTRIYIIEVSLGEGHPLVSYFIPNGIHMGDSGHSVALGSQPFMRQLVNESLEELKAEVLKSSIDVTLIRKTLQDKIGQIVKSDDFISRYGAAYELIFLKNEGTRSASAKTYGTYYFKDSAARQHLGKVRLGTVQLNVGEHGDSRYQTDIKSLQEP